MFFECEVFFKRGNRREDRVMGSIDRIITGSHIGSGGDLTSGHIHGQNLLFEKSLLLKKELVKKPWNVANFLYMQANYICLNKKWGRGGGPVPRMLPVLLFLSQYCLFFLLFNSTIYQITSK